MVHGCKAKFVVIDNPFSFWRKGFYLSTCDYRSGYCDLNLMICDSSKPTCDSPCTTCNRHTQFAIQKDIPHSQLKYLPNSCHFNKKFIIIFSFCEMRYIADESDYKQKEYSKITDNLKIGC